MRLLTSQLGELLFGQCAHESLTPFWKMLPFNMLIKTDYLAVIVPPGLKLKTIHSKISICERREHQKISLEELGGSPYGCERGCNQT